MDSRNAWIMKCSVALSFSSYYNKGEQKTQTITHWQCLHIILVIRLFTNFTITSNVCMCVNYI